MSAPTPDDLFSLARSNPTVYCVLEAWRVGRVPTFEAALRILVVELAKQNAALLEGAILAELARPVSIVLSESDWIRQAEERIREELDHQARPRGR